MANDEHPAMEDLRVTCVLAALSDPLRLGVVRLLSDGSERQWGELDAPVAKSTLSHHLKVLRSAGITQTRMDGTKCYVKLRSRELNERFPRLLDDVIAAAADDVTEVGLKPPRG